LIFILVLAAGAVAGWFYIQYKKTHISTDNAFVEGHIHTIAPRVPGTVQRVLVDDNQEVQRGMLLVELDPEPYEREVEQAEAAYMAQLLRIDEIEAMITTQQKKIRLAQEVLNKALASREGLEAVVRARMAELRARETMLKQAEVDFERAKSLRAKGVIPDEKYDRVKTSLETAEAQVEAAKALLAQAETSLKNHERVIAQARAGLDAQKAVLDQLKASLETQRAMVDRALAALKLARLRLSYTRILSPADGYVTRKAVQVGNQVKAGQPLMAVVPLDDLYIVANYKETKVAKIRPGQRVRIKVDAYPGKVFWGRVHSIMAGTGAAFSLFPPENATGNYVKVVQRIPVKITLDGNPDPHYPLRVGMSVVPTVLVEDTHVPTTSSEGPSTPRHSQRKGT
jgi:membrane fusion protein (multidrug efflux system)